MCSATTSNTDLSAPSLLDVKGNTKFIFGGDYVIGYIAGALAQIGARVYIVSREEQLCQVGQLAEPK